MKTGSAIAVAFTCCVIVAAILGALILWPFPTLVAVCFICLFTLFFLAATSQEPWSG